MERSKIFKNSIMFFIVMAIIDWIAEAIGAKSIPMPVGSIMFFPLLYAMVISLVFYLIPSFKFVGKEQEGVADSLVVLGITVFIAKVAVVSGAALPKVIEAGPALLLQELGNLGTIVLALPIALLLGFKRESIGMTHSIAREPNVGIIANKYGLNSPEGEGVIMIYVVGTLIGTIFMGVFASFMASATSLSPLALAMACGVGSGSMMAASSAPLIASFPQMADQITAFAATSNVLSTADTIPITIFVGLPFANWLYKKLEPILGKGRSIKKNLTIEQIKTAEENEKARKEAAEIESKESKFTKDKFISMTLCILITALIALIGNFIWMKGKVNFTETLIGMIILLAIAFFGNLIGMLVPGKIPSIIWITLIGIILAMPYSPTSSFVTKYVGTVQMLPLATPVLAYAGVTMGKNWDDFKRIGWKGIIVALFVMIGTFVGSAVIAQLVLKAKGII